MTRIVVIGGVAAGMSAASQAKRRLPDASVIALERGAEVSYGACGMPYNIEDPEREMDDLVVITPDEFRAQRGIDVRVRHEVVAIDSAHKQLRVRDHLAERDYTEHYDKLVIATGARAVRPPLPGIDLPGVSVLRDLEDGRAMKQALDQQGLRHVAIIGAGYIGMEMAEVLSVRGIRVSLIERAPQVLPGFAPPISQVVEECLTQHGVRVMTGATVKAIHRHDAQLRVETDGDAVSADWVLVAVGVRPNVDLAAAAGVALGATGAIAVDDHQRTNVPDIYAAGDCAEARHLVSGKTAYIPLGTTANKQGKVAGANAAGGDERFAGIVGTAAFKVFELEVGRTGLGKAEIDALGLDAVEAIAHHSSRGHHYPGSSKITTLMFAERDSERLLGAQMVGAATIAKRIDVLATALHAGMRLRDIESLDLSYAPPFAPVYDPVLIAATVTRKALRRAAKN